MNNFTYMYSSKADHLVVDTNWCALPWGKPPLLLPTSFGTSWCHVEASLAFRHPV